MDDWRIPNESEKKYYAHYKGMQLLQIKFPEFWQRAYETKNNFYQYILAGAVEDSKTFGYEEYLQDDRVHEFWHTHCNFCMKTITADMNEECYCSEDDTTWVCTECFNDFKERFKWKVQANVQDVPAEWFMAAELIASTKNNKE